MRKNPALAHAERIREQAYGQAFEPFAPCDTECRFDDRSTRGVTLAGTLMGRIGSAGTLRRREGHGHASRMGVERKNERSYYFLSHAPRQPRPVEVCLYAGRFPPAAARRRLPDRAADRAKVTTGGWKKPAT